MPFTCFRACRLLEDSRTRDGGDDEHVVSGGAGGCDLRGSDRGNPMTSQQDWERRRKRWAEYKDRVAKRKATETVTCNCYQCHTGSKHVGDGPSGFDYYQDTKRHC